MVLVFGLIYFSTNKQTNKQTKLIVAERGKLCRASNPEIFSTGAALCPRKHGYVCSFFSFLFPHPLIIYPPHHRTLIEFFSPPSSEDVMSMMNLFEQEENLGKMMDFVVNGNCATSTYWGLHFVLELLKRFLFFLFFSFLFFSFLFFSFLFFFFSFSFLFLFFFFFFFFFLFFSPFSPLLNPPFRFRGVELGGVSEHTPVEELPTVVRISGQYLKQIAAILREVLVDDDDSRISSSFGKVVPLRSYRLKVPFFSFFSFSFPFFSSLLFSSLLFSSLLFSSLLFSFHLLSL